MSGFAVIYRSTTDHPLFRDDMARLGAWTWLIMRAAWRPVRYDIRGKIITLERGQLCVSRKQLADEWGWSPSAVERFLTRLKTEQMIGRVTGQGKTVITICNYSKYQDVSDEAGQAPGQAIGQQSDSNRTTKEQGNKVTNKKDNIKHAGAKRPDDVDSAIWKDFNRQRKKVLTDTALRLIQRQADLAGWTLEQAIEEATARGWESFKAEWVKEKTNGGGFQKRSGGGTDKRSGLARAIDAELAGYETTFP
jgi:DNA-binding transcriptional regulator YhcF (GntR family)